MIRRFHLHGGGSADGMSGALSLAACGALAKLAGCGHKGGDAAPALAKQQPVLRIDHDRKGGLWKSWTIGKSHPDAHLPINKGTGIAIDDSFSMVDVQTKHCTTGQFKGQVDPKQVPPPMFQVQYMRGGD